MRSYNAGTIKVTSQETDWTSKFVICFNVFFAWTLHRGPTFKSVVESIHWTTNRRNANSIKENVTVPIAQARAVRHLDEAEVADQTLWRHVGNLHACFGHDDARNSDNGELVQVAKHKPSNLRSVECWVLPPVGCQSNSKSNV